MIGPMPDQATAVHSVPAVASSGHGAMLLPLNQALYPNKVYYLEKTSEWLANFKSNNGPE